MKKLVFVICLSGLLSCHSKRDTQYLSRISNLPSFDMQMMDSVTLLHAAQIPVGKPILFLYFRPDCPHCQAETKEFVSNIDALKQFQIYYLSGADLEDIKGYSNQYHLDQYKNIVVGKDYKHSFTKVFRPSSIPYMAIYDGQKKLLKIYYGEISVPMIVAAIHS